jgi:molybdopterin-guanine dinucleotide biosynthesis protein A
MRIGCVILAGGKATRMGGGDKPLRQLGGVPILDHVLANLTLPRDRIVLNANGGADRFAGYKIPVIPDSIAEFPGPLAGILAGLDWAAQTGLVDDIISVPGDCPFLPQDLVPRLVEVRQAAGARFACAGSGGWTHPVIGLWPVNCREELRQSLLAGERKIDRFTGRFGCATATWPVTTYDPFFNVNTPEELLVAETLLPLVQTKN